MEEDGEPTRALTVQAPSRPALREPRGGEADGALFGRERDFVLLTIFVLMQHRQVEKAGVLAEALVRSGDNSKEALLAHAVATFSRKEFEATLAALAQLDRVDPIERYGNRGLTDRQRMRSYLRARALYDLGDGERNAVDLYLRHHGRKAEDGSS